MTHIFNIETTDVAGSYSFTEPLTNFNYVAFTWTAGYSRFNIFPVIPLLAMQNIGYGIPLNYKFKTGYEASTILYINSTGTTFSFLENTVENIGWSFKHFRAYGIGRIK
mgnify:FL=1